MLWKFLLSLAAVYPHNVHRNTEEHEEYVPTPYGPQTPEEAAVTRNAMHNEGLFGGDILLPEDWNTTDAGVRDTRFRWPGYPGRPIVPVYIHPSVNYLRDRIYAAFEQYHRYTCIRFVPWTYQRDYITIFSGQGCWSYIGRNGGQQGLSLGPGCGYTGLVAHELGHAVGLFHEHQRSDRNYYITVYRDNVVPSQLQNFDLTNPYYELIYTPYDYNSIMHHGNYAFSRAPGRWPTMVAKNGQRLYEPYEKPGLDWADIYRIRKLYNC